MLRKERIRNLTIRQQIGLEETIIKETEQNQFTWYVHVQRMAEKILLRIALKWIPKQESTKKTKEKLERRYKEGREQKKNLNEAQWEDRKQWSLGVRQRRKMF